MEEMYICSTLPFEVKIPFGTIPKTMLTRCNRPLVIDSIAFNLPPKRSGISWLVNMAVFTSTDRADFVMLDEASVSEDTNGNIEYKGYISRTKRYLFNVFNFLPY